MTKTAQEIIALKRDGNELSEDDIKIWIDKLLVNEIVNTPSATEDQTYCLCLSPAATKQQRSGAQLFSEIRESL